MSQLGRTGPLGLRVVGLLVEVVVFLVVVITGLDVTRGRPMKKGLSVLTSGFRLDRFCTGWNGSGSNVSHMLPLLLPSMLPTTSENPPPVALPMDSFLLSGTWVAALYETLAEIVYSTVLLTSSPRSSEKMDVRGGSVRVSVSFTKKLLLLLVLLLLLLLSS